MPPAIRVENLGKSYQIGRSASDRGYRTLRESLVDAAKAPFRRREDSPRTEEFWALMGVEFEVEPGEVIGIIGRNGAGKSTLLKILSRITKPSTGRVELRGRVGSLLEVGTGFHPELTGRENIFLNGSILGMKRSEIARSFDEIVAFAEVESFLDTPVKRYSSGMYVRLAFAVAAHLEPEILLIDEVLAVGDADFQKKCLGKLGKMGYEGRTIIFVSHNMHAVVKLARRSLLLDGGRTAALGETTAMIQEHLESGRRLQSEWTCDESDDNGRGGVVKLTSVRVRDDRGRLASRLRADEGFFIEIDFRVKTEVAAQISFRLVSNSDALPVFTSALSDADYESSTRFVRGDYRARCPVTAHFLAPGSYHLLVAANNMKGPQFDLVEQVLQIEVTSIGSLKNVDNRLGVVTPMINWELATL